MSSSSQPDDSLAGVRDPIPGVLFRIAVPVLASQMLRLAYQWVDALWVRGLGVDATAAVTSSIFVLWWMYSLNDVVAIGITAYISQLLGAGERRRAGFAAFQGLRGSAVLGLAGTLAGVFAARPIFGLMSSDPATVESGSRYLSVVLLGAPLPMMAFTCESIMRAAGNTRTPLLLDAFAVGLNVLLAPLLIYGWGPFPALGVAGAGWATVIAQAVLVASYLVVAARGHRSFPFAMRAEGPPVRILAMVRVGLPAAVIGMLFSVVYIAFARSASRFGVASMAIVSIANRIEAIQFITSVAIGTAGAVLVGQNLGAGRPDRAVQVILTGCRWSLWITGVLTALIMAFPESFLTLFTHDPEVHRIGVPYLRILALCLFVNGLEIVTAESVLGSGHTIVLSWIFTSFSLVRIPLAFWIPEWTGSGVLGIAWIITLTCIVRGLLILAWAARGTWKRGLQSELSAERPPSPAVPG
ncbi:MAG TPA: MATE family efflux transporter [Candidatus Limnocylindria bacterium]|nr:MATE family efflux transporter [Candidatus Limnocylindria bacterium]